MSAPASPLPVGPHDIQAAHRRIAPYLRRTPTWRVDNAFGHEGIVSLKLELLQHAGSFKARGAFNTLLTETVPSAGVAAASGGNHGAAVAYAAHRLGHAATIFVPEITPRAKIDAVRRMGAQVRVGGPRYADALFACGIHIAATGALSIHAYDAEATIAGQGTVALEWEEDAAGGLDTVLVAVGGGGLVAGIGAWFGGRVKVVGIEPTGSCALFAALEAGEPVDVEVNSVAADSLGARAAGRIVTEIACATVDCVALVDDEAILAAQRVLWRDCRIAVEPGGAAALGALMSGAYRATKGERIGVLLCGANVDLATLDALG